MSDPTLTPSPDAARAFLLERRRALYAQLRGVDQQRHGVLMELRSVEKQLGTKGDEDASTDGRSGTRAERGR